MQFQELVLFVSWIQSFGLTIKLLDPISVTFGILAILA